MAFSDNLIRNMFPQAEFGYFSCSLKLVQEARFGSAHTAAIRRIAVVPPGKVQPTVDDVESQFAGQGVSAMLRLMLCPVNRNANFSRMAVSFITGKGQYVGRGRIL